MMHWRVSQVQSDVRLVSNAFRFSGAVEAVAQSSEVIVTPEVLDVYRSLLK